MWSIDYGKSFGAPHISPRFHTGFRFSFSYRNSRCVVVAEEAVSRLIQRESKVQAAVERACEALRKERRDRVNSIAAVKARYIVAVVLGAGLPSPSYSRRTIFCRCFGSWCRESFSVDQPRRRLFTSTRTTQFRANCPKVGACRVTGLLLLS